MNVACFVTVGRPFLPPFLAHLHWLRVVPASYSDPFLVVFVWNLENLTSKCSLCHRRNCASCLEAVRCNMGGRCRAALCRACVAAGTVANADVVFHTNANAVKLHAAVRQFVGFHFELPLANCAGVRT